MSKVTQVGPFMLIQQAESEDEDPPLSSAVGRGNRTYLLDSVMFLKKPPLSSANQ